MFSHVKMTHAGDFDLEVQATHTVGPFGVSPASNTMDRFHASEHYKYMNDGLCLSFPPVHSYFNHILAPDFNYFVTIIIISTFPPT